MSVQRDSGNALSPPAAHRDGLTMADLESLVMDNCGDEDLKPCQQLFEFPSAREDQIVGVSRVVRSGLTRQSRKSTVQSVRREIRECG